jgi:alpha-glucuronidase
VREGRISISKVWLSVVFVSSLLFVLVAASGLAAAETGEAAWLRYAPLDAKQLQQYKTLPDTIAVLGNSEVLATAQSELVRGVRGMLGRTLRAEPRIPNNGAIVIGTVQTLREVEPSFQIPKELNDEGFALLEGVMHGQRVIVIVGGSDRGALYGTFAFLRRIAQGLDVAKIREVQNPSAQIRWVNNWDNLDGSIERGYGGRSIFFEGRSVRADLTRVTEFARLLASVGINGCDITNVNADLHILDPEFIPQLARVAAAFRPYGIRLGVAVNVSAPKQVGGLDTFDPLDPRVADWWQAKFNDVYRAIPDFGGVVVKADSEGQLGPSVYGRNAADAANVIARALKRHGGIVFYRAFVYNHHLDWKDLKADRARAAFDIFHPLDGKFEDNVIIQIKHGPIDFQVREPASPLFGGLEKTNQSIELQISQEYMGQQRHSVYLVPMWKEVLDFDMRVNGQSTPVRELVTGKSMRRPLGGFVGVANVGLDSNWLGNHLAQANLYGFGRLAWNPELSPQAIVEEWTRLTFGNDPQVVAKVSKIQMETWPTYESYSGTLGLQTLTNIVGPHYGPGPESQERNGWGQWIRAEHDAVGMDRTVSTGTGFVGQYSREAQAPYESLANTPDELVLFFHHVPYTCKLHSGKTVIQSIYDSHYDGAARVSEFVREWKSLKGSIDEERFAEVLGQLSYQSGHAIVWRDAINNWFYRLSGIDDEKGRVGHHPNRIEAELMELKGYQPVDVVYWEGASGGKAISCPKEQRTCSAETRFNGSAGQYEIDVEYFDQNDGVSQFRLYIGSRIIDEWRANLVLPTTKPDADSSTRHRTMNVSLRPGDVIRIEGIPDGGERAPLDYIALIETP